MESGTLLNNENGTNGGIVTEIIPDGDNAKVYGTWNEPQPGEKWLFSHVKEVIDNGGHRNLNNKINYGPQSKRWQGNTSTGEVKEMHLTEADFTGTNPRIKMNCWIVGIEAVETVWGTNIEIANIGTFIPTIGKDNYESIYKKPEATTIKVPIWSKYIDLIGSGGRFEIVIKWRSY
jgi:hypothetical protein